MSWSVLWKNGIAAFKVKVKVKVQNVSERLDIFWIIKHFVTKLAMLMQHHEPECHVENAVAIFKVKVTVRLIWSKYDSFYCIFWTVDSLATKLGLMIHYHKPECPVKKVGLLHSGSRSQWRVKMLILSRRFVEAANDNLVLLTSPHVSNESFCE